MRIAKIENLLLRDFIFCKTIRGLTVAVAAIRKILRIGQS